MKKIDELLDNLKDIFDALKEQLDSNSKNDIEHEKLEQSCADYKNKCSNFMRDVYTALVKDADPKNFYNCFLSNGALDMRSQVENAHQNRLNDALDDRQRKLNDINTAFSVCYLFCLEIHQRLLKYDVEYNELPGYMLSLKQNKHMSFLVDGLI